MLIHLCSEVISIENLTGFSSHYNALLNLQEKVQVFKKSFSKNKLAGSDPQKTEFQLEVIKKEFGTVQENFAQFHSSLNERSRIKSQIYHAIKTIFDSRCLKLKIELKRMKTEIKEIKETAKQRKTFLTQARPQYTVEREQLKRRQNVTSSYDYNTDNGKSMTESTHETSVSRTLSSSVMMNRSELSHENKQLKDINRALDKVMSNFQKMGEIVSLHDEMFSDIEMNTMATQVNVDKGKKTLQMIYQDVHSNRSFLFKIFAIITFIAVIFILLK